MRRALIAAAFVAVTALAVAVLSANGLLPAAEPPAPVPAAADVGSGRSADPDTADRHAEVRGMTVSCPTWGWEWGSDEMVATMTRLHELGVNWIAIHPYAGIRSDGTVSYQTNRYREADWIRRPIDEAHRLGLKIMIKPHIAYWGSPFSWRGEIRFDGDAAWSRFFETYTAWIAELAEASAGADAFVVGTELDATVHHEQAWRDVIATVRTRLDAVPLTYSANWDRYETVGFWDALDVIGIQAYFPIVEHTRMPEPEELRRGWRRVLGTLREYGARHDRRILLAELGYNRSARAAYEPWEYRQGGAGAEEVQRRCMEAALEALRGDDRVVGAFLWKWFPGEVERGNFLMSTPAMRAVIAEHWKPRNPVPSTPAVNSSQK